MTLETFIEPLSIRPSILSQLAVDLCRTYQDLALNSTDQFLATPINVLPTGSEKGTVLAIDIGGTNLRVGFVDLLGASKITRSYDLSWPIGNHFKMEKAEDLFAWIGDCIAEVVKNCLVTRTLQGHGPKPLGDVIPLGIAWSFPLIQSSISDATIMQMGKGFAITKDIDLGKLLLGGYERHTRPGPGTIGLPPIKIAAITNDTLATLASLSYAAQSTPESRVVMGLIVGTGVNAAIPMSMQSLHRSKQSSINLPTKSRANHETIVVNTEWSIKGTAGPLRAHDLVTRWDVELDRSCEAPGYMPFEYMAGGRYLGELVRIMACDYFVREEYIAIQDLPTVLTCRNALDTSFLSSTIAVDMSAKDLIMKLKQVLPVPENSIWSWTEERAKVMQGIAQAVQTRSAQMVAAAVVGALACANELVIVGTQAADGGTASRSKAHNELIVAYTGGVISQYPRYLNDCQWSIDSLVSSLSPAGVQQRIILTEVLNGGVIGAGVLAGTIWNLTERQNARP